MEIRYSNSLLFDIKRLHNFFNEKNPLAAQNAISAIRTGINNLRNFSEIGKPIDNLPPEFRELNIRVGASSYMVRYRIGV